jgi:hypothetical protein
MSGPKVVRVVTREELVAAGTSLLARLDAAVQQWQRDCGDSVKPAEVQVTKSRRDALAAMLATDKFGEFGQAAVKEIDFLQADSEQRRERAAQVRAQERIRNVNGQQLARTLLQAGSNLAAQVRRELEKASEGQLSLAEMDAVLSHARQALFPVATQSITPEKKALAQRLGVQETETSFESWKAKSAKLDVRLQSVFAHLAELETLGFAADVGGLEAQLRSVQSMDDDANRNMRLDTLVLAVRKAKDDAVAKMKLLNQVELLAAELSATAGESDALNKLRSVTLTTSLEQLQAMVTLAQTELAKLQKSVSTVARRMAVLEGLQKLGYQVQEGLSTMATESGRLVARSPVNGTYGVELLTGANQKVQVRSIAFDGARDSSQDFAEERRWCGDFSKLQAYLREGGCEVVVEKALGVGATPLRVVETVEENRRSQTAPGMVGRSG